mgnify:CR=1 FL=1
MIPLFIDDEPPEPCSTVPFGQDEDLIGREDVIQQIDDRLSGPGHHRVALVGKGGVG